TGGTGQKSESPRQCPNRPTHFLCFRGWPLTAKRRRGGRASSAATTGEARRLTPGGLLIAGGSSRRASVGCFRPAQPAVFDNQRIVWEDDRVECVFDLLR